MSPRSSRSGPSPSPDVFVGLLFVSVAALVAGISLLVLELNRYGWDMAP
ncbi:MAG: hypothetical protein QF363_03475 [Planctomycetaceae bacterium]|jgi:hypothetical protein|nr:hypothetical protein [Planctomycetaceae bacterium]